MLADDLLRAARSRHAKAPARRRSAAWYDDDVPAPAALTVALTNLLRLDGRTMPDSPDRDALFEYVSASRWLRFALGVGPDEPMPTDDDAGIAIAADDFGKRWQTWMSYRRSSIEVSPPGGPP